MSNPVEFAGQPQPLGPSTLTGVVSHDIMSADLGPTSWFDFDLTDANPESSASTATPSEMTKRPGQILFAPLSTPSQVPKTWADLAMANSSKWGVRASPAPVSAPNQRKTLNIHELFQGGGGSTRSRASNQSGSRANSAWSKGPPTATAVSKSSRAQSPASNAPPGTHSRRQSTLGPNAEQGAVKPGTSSRSVMGPGHHPVNSISFGSINANPAPAPAPVTPTEKAKQPDLVPAASSPPIAAPQPPAPVATPDQPPAPTKADPALNTPATTTPSAAGTPPASTSTPKPKKALNVHALFLGGGGTPALPDVAPQAPASVRLPHHPQHAPHMQPQWGQQPYYYPPQGFDPYMHYWQQQHHPPHPHQHQHIPPHIHNPPMQPSPRIPSAQPRPPSTPPVSTTSPLPPAPAHAPPPISTHVHNPSTPSVPPLATGDQLNTTTATALVPGSSMIRPRDSIRIGTPDGSTLSFEGTAPLSPKVSIGIQAERGQKGGEERERTEREAREDIESLLNKFTTEDFDLISDQIIHWVNEIEEKDGSTLMRATKLIFEKAKDETAFSEMYAGLCREMVDRVSPNIQDGTSQNYEGHPITGGSLFRKYLTGLCQEDFERGWSSESKRQGLGAVRFIGELFKQQMLTERIMHECIKHLLSNAANPKEEEIESLCELLRTVGPNIDTAKARYRMDGYFGQMQEMTKTNDIDPGIQFMLQDVIELRQHWHAPPVVSQPPTPIIYDQSSHGSGTRGIRISRGRGRGRASHRGGRYYSRGGYSEGHSQQTDQWNVAGGSSTVRPPAMAGDLSQFGKVSISSGLSFGPTSVFNKDPKQRDAYLSRASSNMNMFAMLGAAGADSLPQPEAAAARGGASGRKLNMDLGLGGTPIAEGGSVRRRLNLLPRTKPAEIGTEKDGDNAAPEPAAVPAPMSEADAQKKVKEDIREYLGVRSVEEAILALETLPTEHHHIFVHKMVGAALDGGNKVVVLVEKLFAATHRQQLCSAETFEHGLLPTVVIADDISIDVPMVYEWLARLIHAAGIDRIKAEELAGKISVLGEPRVQPRGLLMQEFDGISAFAKTMMC